MPAQDSQGRYIDPPESRAAANVASAARTTTGTGTAFDTSDLARINATLDITVATAATSVPTLDVILETTTDGTNYYTAGTFPQQTAVAAVARTIASLGSLSRWKWTIGGDTPSLTFSITSTTER